MRSGSRTRLSLGYRLALAILSVIGTFTILLSTRPYGAGLSPDSVGYIATARHMAAGIGAVTHTGAPLVAQPPLYPALLATIDRVFGVDPLSSANVTNAVLFGLIVYLSGLLLFNHLRSAAAFALVGTASVLVATTPIQVSLFAWSEPVFICLVLVYLIFFDSYLAMADTLSLLLLATSAALACLARYIGVVLILTGVLGILLRQDRLRVKFRHLFLFLSVSALPIGLWLVRNYFLSGTLFGPRAPSSYTLSQNLGFTFNTFLSWYIPKRIHEHRSLLVLLSAMAGFLAGLSTRGNWSRSRLRTLLSEVGPSLLLIVVYVGFLVVSSTTTAYDVISFRLLSPVFVPTTLLLLLLAHRIVVSLTGQWLHPKHASVLLAVALAAWLVYTAKATAPVIKYATSQGWGYSSRTWRDSQTIKYLLEHQTLASECMLYTNDPEALYVLANLAGKLSPQKSMYNSPEIVTDISDLRGTWPEETNSCLVWFDRTHRDFLFTVGELQVIARMQQITSLEDGTVHSVTRK